MDSLEKYICESDDVAAALFVKMTHQSLGELLQVSERAYREGKIDAEELMKVRIRHDVYRITKDGFGAALKLRNTLADLHVALGLRGFLEGKKTESDWALKERICAAIDQCDSEWLQGFSKLILEGARRTELMKRAEMASVVRWRLVCDEELPTKCRIREICMVAFPELFPVSKSQWTRIHQLAGTSDLPNRVKLRSE